jgi:hypothetical protein
MITNTQQLQIIGCPSHISLDYINEIQPIPAFLKQLLQKCDSKTFFDPHDTCVGYIRDVMIGTQNVVLSYLKSTNTVIDVYSFV